jgi:hypothetical protein
MLERLDDDYQIRQLALPCTASQAHDVGMALLVD